MVWFFERGMEISTLEVRRHHEQFEVAFRHADGNEHIDILSTPHALLTRLEQVPGTMFAEGWRPISNRMR